MRSTKKTTLRANDKNLQANMVRNIIPEGTQGLFMRQVESLGLGYPVVQAVIPLPIYLLTIF
jgi:hypothetical protein